MGYVDSHDTFWLANGAWTVGAYGGKAGVSITHNRVTWLTLAIRIGQREMGSEEVCGVQRTPGADRTLVSKG